MKFEEYEQMESIPDVRADRPAPPREPERQHVAMWTEPDSLPYRETPQGMNLSVLQQNLGNCLQIIDDEVMKGFRADLCRLPVVPLDGAAVASLKDIQFFRVSELVYQENEFSVHKLATMFHALSNKPCTLVLMIRSDGLKNDFYLGVRSLDSRFSSGTMRQMLEQSLSGMFPGSRIDIYDQERMKEDMDSLDAGCVSSVTCVADFKQEKDDMENREFLQGLEKFVDSMQGKAYTAIFIAENVSHKDLMQVKKEYESIYTQIAPFSKMQLNFSSSSSKSTASGQSNSQTQNMSYGQNWGESHNAGIASADTEGTNESRGSTDSTGTNASTSDGMSTTNGVSDGVSLSESDAHTDGTTNTFGGSVGAFGGAMAGMNFGVSLLAQAGVNAGANLGTQIGFNASHGVSKSDTHTITHGKSHTISQSESISRTLTHGINQSHSDSSTYGTNRSHSLTQTENVGTQQGKSMNVGEAFSLVDSETLTDTFGASQGITLNAQNRTLNTILQRLEQHLKRIEECESIGMWNFAAYFVGESAAETETAANMYQSIVSGLQSGIERSAVNTWMDEEQTAAVFSYIKNFLHPRFWYEGFDYESVRTALVNPAVLVSTNELAIHMGLPRHSVKGLPVTEHTTFAQEVLKRGAREGETFALGNVYHLGRETGTEVALDVGSLSMHTFITGSTGSGKSNTVYEIVSKLNRMNDGAQQLAKQVPTLIIEPAKGEYKQIFGDKFHVYGTNPYYTELLRINPFKFEPGIHILEHIDRLIEIFNVCWPMYAAMPAVLKEAVERAYIAAGWDLDTSQNRYDPVLYPCFADVLAALRSVINASDYSQEVKDNYTGSLITRVKSLTNGLNGQIFTSNEVDQKALFEESAIVDLSRVGSGETKAMIMGILVIRLQERRMSQGGINLPLRHVTVLEEAHNLLKRTSTEQNSETANLMGKAVELLSTAIAEMRTYGEGFIIVDQSPGLMDMSVIRNTNTKIILKLPEYSDRELVGKSAGLTDGQIAELAKLPSGVAAVYQNKWVEPVLCKVGYYDAAPTEYRCGSVGTFRISERALRGQLLQYVLSDISGEAPQVDAKSLKKELLASNLPASLKIRGSHILDGERPRRLEMVYDFVADCVENMDEMFLRAFRSQNIEEWNQQLLASLDFGAEELSSACQYNILESIIYQKSCEQGNDRENFSKWMDYMGRRVI